MSGTPSAIVVINPNSTPRITNQIRAAIDRVAGDSEYEVLTSHGGPRAIESDRDVSDAIGPMLELARSYDAAAYIVACFSDPGLDELREAIDKPVFGIAESAVAMAMARGRNLGVVSSVSESVPRHDRYWKKLGVTNRIVADVAIGRGVLDLEGPDAFSDTIAAARSVASAGADVIILGCTGLAPVRGRLQDELGVPVVDPCQAAATIARATVQAEGDTL